MKSLLHSVAGCSSYFFHYPSRVLFDAGEGVSEKLKNYIFGIEKVFITHDHWDHIGGLPGLIFSRKKNRGDNDKPLDIYYPASCAEKINQIRAFVGDRTIPINWHVVNLGDKIAINKNWFVETFRTYHTRQLTLGYAIREERLRLKPGIKERIQEILANGGVKPEHQEVYTQSLFVWALDAYKIDNEEILRGATVVFDGTFADENDRDDGFKSHMTWTEIKELSKKYNVKHAIIAHISPRYSEMDVKNRVHKFKTSEFATVITADADFDASQL